MPKQSYASFTHSWLRVMPSQHHRTWCFTGRQFRWATIPRVRLVVSATGNTRGREGSTTRGRVNGTRPGQDRAARASRWVARFFRLGMSIRSVGDVEQSIQPRPQKQSSRQVHRACDGRHRGDGRYTESRHGGWGTQATAASVAALEDVGEAAPSL